MARNSFYEAVKETGLLSGLHTVPARILLEMAEGKLMLHGSPARVAFRKDKISIGCTDVSPEALRYLLTQFEAWLKGEEYILQP